MVTIYHLKVLVKHPVTKPEGLIENIWVVSGSEWNKDKSSISLKDIIEKVTV